VYLLLFISFFMIFSRGYRMYIRNRDIEFAWQTLLDFPVECPVWCILL